MTHRCNVGECEWVTEDMPSHISGCLASWHMYEEHPDVWRNKIGDRPPRDPDPRTDEGMADAMIQHLFLGI